MKDLAQEKQRVIDAQKDPEAFTALYREYYPQIYGYILKRCGNVHAAEDITSEVFFRVLNNLHKFKWQDISFSAWLYRIAINETNRYLTKHGKTLVVDLWQENIEAEFMPADNNTPEALMMENQDESAQMREFGELREAVAALPEKYQDVVMLRYFEKKSILEIAQILDKKEGTVKSLLSRAIDRLEKTQPLANSRVIDYESQNSTFSDQKGANNASS